MNRSNNFNNLLCVNGLKYVSIKEGELGKKKTIIIRRIGEHEL